MPASKRRRRTIVPVELLLFIAVSLAFPGIYWTALTLHERMLKHPRTTWTGDDPPLFAPEPDINAGFVLSKPSHSQEETPPTTHISEYSRLYGERQRSWLAGDATNLGPEAVKRADDWKRAGDWDQGFLRMNETLKAGLDPALPQAVPAFQVPPFQVPAVQIPAVPTCCVAP